MDKSKAIKTGILVGALGGLVIGGASGYFAGASVTPLEQKSLSETVISQQRAPRFGETKVVNPAMEQKAVAAAKEKVKDVKTILNEGDQMKRMAGLLEYYNGLTHEQMADEAKRLSLMSWEDRMVASKMLFTKWAEVAPKQAMEYAGKQGFRGGFEKMMIMDAWSSKNPEMAAAYYAENKDILDNGRGRGGRTADAIAKGWTRLDPEAALNWAKGMEGNGRNGAISSVFDALVDKDPALAVQKLGTLSAEDLKDSRIIDNIASKWARTDWTAAEAWLNTLPADQQEQARSRALQGLAEVDAAAAAQKVSQMADGAAKDSAVSRIVSVLAAENPVQAAEWVLKNASQDAMARSVGDVVSSWVYTDTTGAKNWVNGLPAGAARNRAIMSYAMTTPSTNYSETLSMVSGMQVESNDRNARWEQAAAMRNAYSKWAGQDAEAAKAWVQGSGMSDRQKERLISGDRRGSGAMRRGGPRH